MLLLDTNISSFMLVGSPHLEPFVETLAGKTLAISVFTVAEHWGGAYMNKWGAKRRRTLEDLLGQFTVLDATHAVAYDVAYLERVQRERGRPVGPRGSYDTWIAATARTYKLPLVTHNLKHFENFPGLTLVPPTGNPP